MRPSLKIVLRIAVCLAAVAAIVRVYEAIYAHAGQVRLAIVALTFLLAVLFVSAAWGWRYAIFISVLATLAQNYFFLPPIHSFAVDNPLDLATVIVFLITGITAGQLAERARRSQRELQDVINAIPAQVQSALPDGSIDFVNQRWVEFTGLPLETALGWNWEAVIHSDDRTRFIADCKAALTAGQPTEHEVRVRQADGQYRWLLTRNVPLRDEHGKILKWYGTAFDIEDRRRAEQALRRSEAYLAEAQRLTHTGSWARNMATGETTHSSEEHSRLYGFDPKLGVPSFEAFSQRIHPEDRAMVVGAFKRAMRERTDFEVDFRTGLPDGTVKYIHGVGHPVLNAAGDLIEYVGTARDITDLKRAEEGLRERAELLNLTSDAIFVRDLNNLIKYWNRGAQDLYGWTAGQTVGKFTTHELLKTVFPMDLARVEAELLSAGRWAGELVHTRRDGAQVVVASRWSLQRDERGAPVAVLESNRDITERKQAEEALRKAQATLAHVTRVTTLGEVSASISHELNQPLAAIVNNANACLGLVPSESPGLEEVRDALADMVSDDERASAIIERVRRMARRSAPEQVPLQLAKLVDEVLALAVTESTARRVEIHTEVPGDLPVVLGDRVQLQQVLLNLLVNAMDAMSSVEESVRRIEIVGQPETHSSRLAVQISVCDCGSGFDAQQTEKLFEIFYTTKSHGMGLGLAICRSIIEAHGARLWAEPNKGPGATFSFSLPALSEA